MWVYDPDFDSRHGIRFFLPNVQSGSTTHPALCGYSLRVKRPVREAAHSAASSAEVKWLIFTLLYVSTAFTGTSLIVAVIITFHFGCICFFTWFTPRNKQNLSICWHFSLQCPFLGQGCIGGPDSGFCFQLNYSPNRCSHNAFLVFEKHKYTALLTADEYKNLNFSWVCWPQIGRRCVRKKTLCFEIN